MFEKTLTDIVKGIRASKRDTALYISQCIKEIKQEINSTDLYVKANALNKLTFLQMMGYDMSWASFATIEVMSSPRFAHKRIGYLAACQGFTQDTEVVLLTTNLLQKELRSAVAASSGALYEAGLAINCISNIVTEDLARDLLPEVTALLNHPQPYLRKKTVLCLFKLFLKYPQGLRVTFDKIQLCLDDANPSVVSCAVNVITELSDANPRNYLHLAPSFFGLLTQSQNNWMLIKVVKLLGGLVPEEPRLARKLLEPLSEIVQTTQAKSLLYEACYTITLCLPYCRKADGSMPSIVPQIVQLCGRTFREFLADQDQNLKYLGLVGFCSLVVSHPKVLVEIGDTRPLILKCLSDDDITIRTRALDLLRGMASRKNLVELIGQLLQHVEAASGQYRKDLVLKVVELCSADKYALLQDFNWYFRILLDLAQGSPIPELQLEKQILDVALRVLPVRAYAVQECTKVLLLQGATNVLPQVLSSMAWIVGEYSDLLTEKHPELVLALLMPSPKIDATTRAVFVQAAMKVFAASTQKAKSSEIEECVGTLTKYLPVYTQSLDVEVQERAFTGLELLKSLRLTPSALDAPGLEDSDVEENDMLGMGGPVPRKTPKSGSSLASRCRSSSSTLNYLLKPEPMKPISGKAQRKKRQNPLGGITAEYLDQPLDVSVFELILHDTINAPKPSMEQVSFTQQRPFTSIPAATAVSSSIEMVEPVSSVMASPVKSGMSAMESTSTPFSQSTSLNQTRSSADPFYLDSGTRASQSISDTANRFGTIQLLDSDMDDEDDDKRKKKKKEKKKKRAKQQPTSLPAPVQQTIYASDEEDDDGAFLTSSVAKAKKPSADRGGLAQIDLTKPLGADESIMPNREHRVVPQRSVRAQQKVAAEEPSGRKKKKKKKKKESKKSKQETSTNVGGGGGVGDLLDLGGFSSVVGNSNSKVPIDFMAPQSAPVPAPQTAAPVMLTAQPTPITSAFDDLLSLEAPAPAAQMTMAPSFSASPAAAPALPTAAVPTKKSGKKAWLRSTVKSANAEASAIAWSQVSLYHKISPAQPSGVNVTFRLESDSMIPNVSLTLRDSNESISFGTVQGKAEAKMGPIPFETADMSKELKGFLSSNGSSRVPIKFVLPASVFLTPPPTNMTLDSAMIELSSEPFESNSCKIPLSVDFSKAKTILTGFFNATVVDENVSGALMLASQSTRGTKVRVLVKQKDSATVKVDIKCNNGTLGASLASDVKKIVL